MTEQEIEAAVDELCEPFAGMAGAYKARAIAHRAIVAEARVRELETTMRDWSHDTDVNQCFCRDCKAIRQLLRRKD